MVIVDLWILDLRLIINHHEEEAQLSYCCSSLFRVPCVRQVTSKGGGKPIIATRCRRFAKENRKRHSSEELVPRPEDGVPVSGRGIKMMMATEAEKASAL